MMLLQTVFTEESPIPNPVISQAIIFQGLVYLSGQTGVSPLTQQLVEGSISVRTKQILENIAAVLKASGSCLDLVIKVNIFLKDMADFTAVNQVYSTFFSHHKPSRTCVAVTGLPKGTDIEIECTAALSTQQSG